MDTPFPLSRFAGEGWGEGTLGSRHDVHQESSNSARPHPVLRATFSRSGRREHTHEPPHIPPPFVRSRRSPRWSPSRAAADERAYDFWFTRLMYESGDWDVDQRMPANLLDSLVAIHDAARRSGGARAAAGRSAHARRRRSATWPATSWCEFNPDERRNFERYVRNGGFVFVDDCNHDIDGLFAKSFESEMAAIFGADALKKMPKNHAVFSSFFNFDGPPNTAFELNGWGDDLVHDYLKGIEIDGRLGVLYSNKDYGCEWDYDWRNKRWLAEDNTKFAVNVVVYALTS